ncbi:hypothetical protein HMPREF1992_01846 [Selenomonas sp. oral taxon 892 str. F0426]|nr:hypothetical protein HMPREF1992_01846 [Selenomonas sp. oral taxon 892 str. F0426]
MNKKSKNRKKGLCSRGNFFSIINKGQGKCLNIGCVKLRTVKKYS